MRGGFGWQPGDVAAVTITRRDGSREPGAYRAIFGGTRGWFGVKDGEWCGGLTDHEENFDIRRRPLVVIDPDDGKQVTDLAAALIEEMCTQDPDWDEAREYEVRSHLRAALRSLIADPKPPEPLGLGAVVEDAEGWRWMRSDGGWWRSDVMRAGQYADIAAVKVLSEGVTDE